MPTHNCAQQINYTSTPLTSFVSGSLLCPEENFIVASFYGNRV